MANTVWHGTPITQCKFSSSSHIVSKFTSTSATPLTRTMAFTHPLAYLKYLTTSYTEEEKAGLRRIKWFESEGRGYSTEQSTQPQTLGYSLADSPVGLLAWIYEKLVNWTDAYPWDDDEGADSPAEPARANIVSFQF